MRTGEKIIKTIHSPDPIGCCGGHEFYLISTNGGYTTECTCGHWCGQWYPDQGSAIWYFENMVQKSLRRNKDMTLPTYDKNKRKKSFQQLPKGAYVVKIKDAKQEQWPSGDGVIRIAFDIAEGEYMGFYQNQFDNNTNEDKKWPMDAVFNLNVPNDGCQQYVWDNWNTFFADLEDSNGGFVFGGDLKSLRGKIIGGLFHNRQSKYNGNVYDHIVMRFTRPAADIRSGKFGKLPNDKLVDNVPKQSPNPDTGFMSIEDTTEEVLPF